MNPPAYWGDFWNEWESAQSTTRDQIVSDIRQKFGEEWAIPHDEDVMTILAQGVNSLRQKRRGDVQRISSDLGHFPETYSQYHSLQNWQKDDELPQWIQLKQEEARLAWRHARIRNLEHIVSSAKRSVQDAQAKAKEIEQQVEEGTKKLEHLHTNRLKPTKTTPNPQQNASRKHVRPWNQVSP